MAQAKALLNLSETWPGQLGHSGELMTRSNAQSSRGRPGLSAADEVLSDRLPTDLYLFSRPSLRYTLWRMKPRAAFRRPTLAKLFFNPASGAPGQSPMQLMQVISEMQALNYMPEVCIIQEGSDPAPAIRDALRRGIGLFVVCGGDGTVNPIAAALIDKRATLGIIPTGTRNNLARSLGIPDDIRSAVALLQSGRRIKVDTGKVTCDGLTGRFLEVCSVGLISAVYQAADNVQHGNLGGLRDLLTALFAAPESEMRIMLDGKKEIHAQGHGVLVSNASYFGLSYRLGPPGLIADGFLDVLIFADVSKLDLLSGAVQQAGSEVDDTRIQRYWARQIVIKTTPPMPVMADGVSVGEGQLRITIKPKTLAVVAGELDSRETRPARDRESEDHERRD